MYLEIHTSINHQYYFVIKSLGNRHVLATSEQYVAKQDAIHAAELIANSGVSDVYDVTLK